MTIGAASAGKLSPDYNSVSPPGAIILGGAHGSLAVARSLGRQGIPVWFVSNDHPLPSLSRYVRRSFKWPGPNDSRALAFLLKLAEDHHLHGWVVFAGSDADLQFAGTHHAALAATYRLMTPPLEIARWSFDKKLTYARAGDVGIDYPWSFYPKSVEELAQLNCRFPVILKPTVRETVNEFTRAKAWRCDDRDTLVRRYAQARALVGADAISVQEWIPGTGQQQFSYAGVWRDGEPVASLTARRTRQFPIDFGFTSTFVETIDNPDVEAAATRFLRSIGYAGLVEIEFKYDARECRYKMLDFNARAWAWISLGAPAGVDFPQLAWKIALGQPVNSARGRSGVSWVHVARDLVSAAQEMRAGVLNPTQWASGFLQQRVFAAFALDDPLPGLLELPLVVGRQIGLRARAWRRQAHHPAILVENS